MAQSRKKKPGFGPSKQGKVAKAAGPKKLGPAGIKKAPQGQKLNRAVASLAEVIRALRTEDGSDSVDTRVAIGQHLADVRKMLPSGQWLQFLSDEVGYAFRTAQRLMQLNSWASQNKPTMLQVRSWGPTKVYHVMDAGPAVARQLLSRKRFVVGSGKRKSLGMLTSVELKGVLAPLAEALDGEERQEVAQVYKRLLRCTKRLETVLYESS